MTDKEKAKAYDKLFVKAQQIYNKENDVLIIHTIEDLFPELKEADDERIRKEIIKYLEQTVPHNHRDEVLKSKEWIAWLEKQNKRRTWSEEDEDFFNDIIAFLEDTKNALDHANWIKSLKQRIR